MVEKEVIKPLPWIAWVGIYIGALMNTICMICAKDLSNKNFHFTQDWIDGLHVTILFSALIAFLCIGLVVSTQPSYNEIRQRIHDEERANSLKSSGH